MIIYKIYWLLLYDKDRVKVLLILTTAPITKQAHGESAVYNWLIDFITIANIEIMSRDSGIYNVKEPYDC